MMPTSEGRAFYHEPRGLTAEMGPPSVGKGSAPVCDQYRERQRAVTWRAGSPLADARGTVDGDPACAGGREARVGRGAPPYTFRGPFRGGAFALTSFIAAAVPSVSTLRTASTARSTTPPSSARSAVSKFWST